MVDLVCTVLCKLSHVQSEDSKIRKCGLERAMKSRKVLRTKLESVWRSGTCLTQSESFPSPRPTRPSPGRSFGRTETPTSFGSRLLLFPADSAVPAGKNLYWLRSSSGRWKILLRQRYCQHHHRKIPWLELVRNLCRHHHRKIPASCIASRPRHQALVEVPPCQGTL